MAVKCSTGFFVEKQGQLMITCDLRMPDSLRAELRKPLGQLMESGDVAELLKESKEPVVAIGDSVSLAMIENGVFPKLIVWDKKTTRKPCPAESTELLKDYAACKCVTNPPGHITKEAWDAVSSSLDGKRESILVKGEEDLLTLPAILNSADGTNIVYGSPGKGAILIVVNPKIKKVFRDILTKFESIHS